MLFPEQKCFAFSILDDTDDATVENVKPVYDTLIEYGFRTTKTAWPLDCPEGSAIFFAAETLQNPAYLRFVHTLVARGFELAFHGATMESSRRERTIEGLEFIKQEFGSYPKLFCNHGHNRENLYWGAQRFQTPLLRRLVQLVRQEPSDYYAGEKEESEFFWGDLCKKYIKYVRNFTFYQLNMRKVNPEMPYRLPETRYVNYWFSTADAPDVHAFNKLFTGERLDQLEAEGGVCIVSTHLGKGFVKDGKLNANTERILRSLSQKPGWFVPVSDILDYLLKNRQFPEELSPGQRCRLEFRFLLDKMLGRKLCPVNMKKRTHSK